ncbi:hypothetical protein KEM48_008901 [Puccinia striiformis f. sp. tritici PST-130]|nr:hypothetical protein KEM48_008901 [Puccinia striiformis f. sp. tritici PST-130]
MRAKEEASVSEVFSRYDSGLIRRKTTIKSTEVYPPTSSKSATRNYFRFTRPYNPSDSQENQAGLLNLELILKTQRELEENLNRIYSSFYPLCPRDPGGVSNQTEDHHNQDIKFGRLRVLNHLFTERLLKSLQESFVVSYGLVHQLGLSDTLKEIIKHLNRSELDNLQRLWSVEVFAIDKHLTDFTKRSNNLPIEVGNRPSSPDTTEDFAGIPPNSDSAIQMAESLIPITKLSRMFFRKLSQTGMNRKRLPLFTKMCSAQLQQLANSAKKVLVILSGFQKILISGIGAIHRSHAKKLAKIQMNSNLLCY